MEEIRQKTTYGIGCITVKQTNPPHGGQYVYAEWSAGGQRHCRSCGNSAYPHSWRRARELLHEALKERIGALEAELASLQEILKLNAKPDLKQFT